MSKRSFPALPAASLLLASLLAAFGADETAPISRILFGSCIREQDPVPILNTIASQAPDIVLFAGDNIYADTEDMEVMKAKYARLKRDPGFIRLLATCPTFATWDDHDYGADDAGASYPRKVEAEQIFLDFWQLPPGSPSRQRPGIYDSHLLGPPGKRVQLILLDTRYFRGPLTTGERRLGGPYRPSTDAASTLLGPAQWEWLDQQLRQPAEIRIIVSSIQCVSDSDGQETWSNLPHERQRLFDLIRATGASGVVILSGDRHWAELSVQTDGVPYPLYDLTSSSLNQIHKRGTPTRNQFRAMPPTYHRENFGAVLIDWNQAVPGIALQIRDLRGNVVLSKRVPLSLLQSPPIAPP